MQVSGSGLPQDEILSTGSLTACRADRGDDNTRQIAIQDLRGCPELTRHLQHNSHPGSLLVLELIEFARADRGVKLSDPWRGLRVTAGYCEDSQHEIRTIWRNRQIVIKIVRSRHEWHVYSCLLRRFTTQKRAIWRRKDQRL